MVKQTSPKSILKLGFGLVILALTGCSTIGPSSIGSCTELADQLSKDMTSACSEPDSQWVSGFCNTCVKAKLFSYTKSSAGACECAPLTFADEVCAGNEDHGKIVAAIVAADSECTTYTLALGAGGTAGAAGAAGGGAAGN